MKNSPKVWPILSALMLALSLAGCVMGGMPAGAQAGAPHLSATQCRDLTAIKSNAPPTHERNMSELAALKAAGYDPSPWFDPYYPEDLQQAQRLVDQWYQEDCQQARPQ